MTTCLVCGSPIPAARLHHPIPAVTCSRQCAIERKRANDRASSARRYDASLKAKRTPSTPPTPPPRRP